MPTRRERTWDLLQQRADGCTPRDLAEALDSDEASVLEDLRHLAKSARRTGLALHMMPAKCRSCGWTGEAESPRNPAKCPACKSTWLDAPRFRVAPR